MSAAAARTAGLDPLSDKATALLIRRTLCLSAETAPVTSTVSVSVSGTGGATPDAAPLETLLPPLTSRNDVDRQLYALLAVVVREFVLTWYSRITPDDTQLVTELVQIVAHCTRALEQRLRAADLEALVADELPRLLDNHVRAYRASRTQLAGPGIGVDARAAYHALWPLPALSPVPSLVEPSDAVDRAQALNEAAYRQLLVDGLLEALLPPEDLDNACLSALVGQILAELLLGNVLARRVAEPWMMWEVIGLVARIVREKTDPDSSGDGKSLGGRDRKDGKDGKYKDEKDGPSPRRKRTSRRARDSDVPETPTANESDLEPPHWLAVSASSLFLAVLHAGFAVCAALRVLVASVSLARSLPPRGARTAARHDQLGHAPASTLTPVLSYSVWTVASDLVQLPERMPWLHGLLSMVHWLAVSGPGRLAGLNGPLDRLLSHHIQQSVLDADLLPGLLRTVRGAVFPGNRFGQAPPSMVEPADDVALRALKRRTAEDVYAVWGRGRTPTESALAEIEGALLDVFDDAYCNRHLLYSIVEAVFVRLVPEMADSAS